MRQPKSHWMRFGVVALGLLLPQTWFYGPACIGRTYLYPLDLLARPGFFLADTKEFAGVVPIDTSVNDLVVELPYYRDFVAKEFAAGRLPLWSPHQFCGAPFVNWPKYSPFESIGVLFPSPLASAWIQLVAGIVAGSGFFIYSRRVLRIGYWPACFTCWSFPWIGYFTLWSGFPLTHAVACLPWVLWFTHRACLNPLSWAPIHFAVSVAVLLFSRFDAGLQVLLVAALQTIFQLLTRLRREALLVTLQRGGITLSAVLIGVLSTAIYFVPLLDYVQEGMRFQERSTGVEERPPRQLSEIWLIAFPDFYGSNNIRSLPLNGENQLESAACGYAGLISLLIFAPLAFRSRPHRPTVLALLILGVIGAGWQLNFPPIVALFRLPVLNGLPSNRFVFATAFATTALAAIGLHSWLQRGSPGRAWLIALMLVSGAASLTMLARSFTPPEPLRTHLAKLLDVGQAPKRVTRERLTATQQSFATYHSQAALVCCSSFLCLGLACFKPNWGRLSVCGLVLLNLGDMLLFAADENRQADSKFFFPPVPAFHQLHEFPPGRFVGVGCLPPPIGYWHGLLDVRGYDAVDPKRYIELLRAGSQRDVSSPRYARTMETLPQILSTKSYLRLHPVYDLLNVRYVIIKGVAPPELPPIISGSGFTVIENRQAVGQAFIPQHSIVLNDVQERLKLLARVDFQPTSLAILEQPVPLPSMMKGQVKVVSEVPGCTELDVHAETDSLVVVSQQWAAGWVARIDEGARADILRVDHALCGVIVPAGAHKVKLIYDPPSWRRGLLLSCVAAGLLGIWSALLLAWPAIRQGSTLRQVVPTPH